MTTDDKALSLVPQIKEAHDKATAAQQSGYQQSLQAAIDAGELLIRAKEAVGTGGWTKWREKHLNDVPQTTVSLYIRLAKNKERFSERAISNSVANLRNEGKLSIRSAAALLSKAKPRGKPPNKPGKGEPEDWLKALDVDELVIVLRQVFDSEYIGRLAKALAPVVVKPASTIASIAANVERQSIVRPTS